MRITEFIRKLRRVKCKDLDINYYWLSELQIE